ncbi:hypothetical protein ACWGQ5_24305 [Streptomyces sp. NPDC055722]
MAGTALRPPDRSRSGGLGRLAVSGQATDRPRKQRCQQPGPVGALLVVGTRQGRSVVYSLYDNHVAELLAQALYHVEHLHLGLSDRRAGD